MLLTLIGPGTLIAPAPVAPKIAPLPAPLFHAAPDQFKLLVSQMKLPPPLSQVTSAPRALDVTPMPAHAATAAQNVAAMDFVCDAKRGDLARWRQGNMISLLKFVGSN